MFLPVYRGRLWVRSQPPPPWAFDSSYHSALISRKYDLADERDDLRQRTSSPLQRIPDCVRYAKANTLAEQCICLLCVKIRKSEYIIALRTRLFAFPPVLEFFLAIYRFRIVDAADNILQVYTAYR